VIPDDENIQRLQGDFISVTLAVLDGGKLVRRNIAFVRHHRNRTPQVFNFATLPDQCRQVHPRLNGLDGLVSDPDVVLFLAGCKVAVERASDSEPERQPNDEGEVYIIEGRFREVEVGIVKSDAIRHDNPRFRLDEE
jgi:hypothetical protein